MKSNGNIENGFIVKGSDFNKSVKLLKKAFSRKKKEQEYATTVFKVSGDQVLISMPGAEVQVKADGFGHFRSEVPFTLFKDICSDHYDRARSYTFEFTHGLLTVDGVSYRFPDITFHSGLNEGHDDSNNKASFLNMPLLGIYYQLKKYPPGTLTDRRFMEGNAEIEKILTKVDSLLRPLGLGRDVIEKILDDRSPFNSKKPKYSKAQLWAIAFNDAYKQYFKTVDDAGNPIKCDSDDFDYESLSEEEAALFDDFYSSASDYCEELFYKTADQENN